MSHLLIRFAAGIFLLWSAVAVVIGIAAFTLAAHHNTDQGTTSTAATAAPTPLERVHPPGVPADARLVISAATFGDTVATRPGANDAAHIFYWLTCDGRLLTIATTRETIYAELDCGRYWLVNEVLRPYQGQPVRVGVSAGSQGTLVLESVVATARFDVDAVWIDAH